MLTEVEKAEITAWLERGDWQEEEPPECLGDSWEVFNSWWEGGRTFVKVYQCSHGVESRREMEFGQAFPYPWRLKTCPLGHKVSVELYEGEPASLLFLEEEQEKAEAKE